MTNWVNEEIFKTLTEAHKRLWEGFFAVLPHMQGAESKNLWLEAYARNLSSWEDAVKQTLKTESTWMAQLTEQLASKQGMPESMSGWMQQFNEVMHHWVETQNQLWDDCFRMLRSDNAIQELVEQETQSETAVPAEQPETVSRSVETEVILHAEPSIPGEREDDLKTISGLGPALEKRLNTYGINTYRQLATLSEEEIRHIEKSVIKLSGRIHRDQWIEQAKQQHFRKYQEKL
jgi:predicted flap endonuclease-1-like 5' DNA nuclease